MMKPIQTIIMYRSDCSLRNKRLLAHFLLLISVLVLVACIKDNRDTNAETKGEVVANDTTRAQRNVVEDSTTEASSSKRTYSELATAQRFHSRCAEESMASFSMITGVGSLYRTSDNYNEQGRFQPPWTKRILSFDGLRVPPVNIDSVIIVPFVDSLPLSIAPVRNITKAEVCSQSKWELDNARVNIPEYTHHRPKSETSFRFAVVTPESKCICFLNAADHELPEGFAADVSRLILDTSGDGLPNVAFFEYCCSKPRQPFNPLAECMRCSASYHKDTSGQWTRTYISYSC